MKKLLLTIAIVLGLNAITFAQDGLFQRGNSMNDYQWVYFRNNIPVPILPYQHNLNGSQDADAVPLGSGVLSLIGLGVGYAIVKRKRNECLVDEQK